jgi:hypothetical protein
MKKIKKITVTVEEECDSEEEARQVFSEQYMDFGEWQFES